MAGSHGVGGQQLSGSGKAEHNIERVPRQQGSEVSWGREPRSHPLECPCLAVGITATPALGCAPGKAAGTQLQMAALKAWVEEEGSFPAILVSVLSSELKSDGYLDEGFILDTDTLKSFSFPLAFSLKDLLSPCLFPEVFPFPCFPLRGKKKFLNQQ